MVKRGDTVEVEGLGSRRVRLARKSGRCAGWIVKVAHAIEPGDLYVETEG